MRAFFSILFSNISYFFRNIRKYFKLKWLLIVLGVLAVIVAGYFIIRETRKTPSSETSFANKKEIVIGIEAPSAFSYVDDGGEISGYEKDLADELFGRLYPGIPLRYEVIKGQQASYLLRTGEIDVAFGMFVSGPIKTQGLTLSNSYFTDGVYVFLKNDSPVTTLFGLTNKRVRVLSSDITKNSVNSMFKKLKISVDLHLCSSYEDGHSSLMNEDSVAIAAPYYKLCGYDDLRTIEEAIGSAPYRIMLWTDKKDVVQVINRALAEMRGDGSLKALMEKWDLTEYDE